MSILKNMLTVPTELARQFTKLIASLLEELGIPALGQEVRFMPNKLVFGFAVCGDKPNNPYVSKVDCLYSCSFGHINCPDGIGAPFSKADIEFVG